jgi:hypothetical protein
MHLVKIVSLWSLHSICALLILSYRKVFSVTDGVPFVDLQGSLNLW